ncbi:hypothetical protein OSTOST_23105 [Ostertagia ostertagi]
MEEWTVAPTCVRRDIRNGRWKSRLTQCRVLKDLLISPIAIVSMWKLMCTGDGVEAALEKMADRHFQSPAEIRNFENTPDATANKLYELTPT